MQKLFPKMKNFSWMVFIFTSWYGANCSNFANKIKNMTNKDVDFSNEKVLQFYKELPFNYYSSVEEQSKIFY